jgi:hypothetical protein
MKTWLASFMGLTWNRQYHVTLSPCMELDLIDSYALCRLNWWVLAVLQLVILVTVTEVWRLFHNRTDHMGYAWLPHERGWSAIRFVKWAVQWLALVTGVGQLCVCTPCPLKYLGQYCLPSIIPWGKTETWLGNKLHIESQVNLCPKPKWDQIKL